MAVERTTKDKPPINRTAVYTLAQFFHGSGMGRSGLRAAERRGLKTVRIGGRKFVRGEDWFEFLEQQEAASGS